MTPVVVSMAYWRVPQPLLDRAVESVLAQAHPTLLVVVGDGEPPPLTPRPGLVAYTLPENRGPYFCHQLVLEASPSPLFAVHDADDWSEPYHVKRLAHWGTAVPGCIWWHTEDDAPPTTKRRKLGWHVGVYQRDRLLSIGGYDPSERLSQDTHMLRLLDLTGKVPRAVRPSYHRLKRRDSLTTHPDTHVHHPTRVATRARNRQVLRQCHDLAPDLHAIREYRASKVDPAIRAELEEHVAILGGLLR